MSVPGDWKKVGAGLGKGKTRSFALMDTDSSV